MKKSFKYMFYFVFLPYFFLCLLLVTNSWAQPGEALGQAGVSEIYLEPTAILVEGRTGEFSVGNSKLGFEWNQDQELGVVLSLGSKEQIVQPRWAASAPSKDFGLYEVYGRVRTEMGDFRLGMIPLNFGFEGSLASRELWLPRTLLYSQRYVGLYDYGAAYAVSNGEWTSQVSIHNGEGGAQSDSQGFYTGHVRWRGKGGLTAGLSAQVGGYQSSALGGAVRTVDRLRIGNFYTAMDVYGIGFVVEGTVGEEQTPGNLNNVQFAHGHVDAEHNFGSQYRLILRYDYLEPNTRAANDTLKQYGLGIRIFNRLETSSVLLLATRKQEEGDQTPNDEFRLQWRITSLTGR